jgi:prepilin-type processing-associated H-X9-DG protein
MDENPYRSPNAGGDTPRPEKKGWISPVLKGFAVLGIILFVLALFLPTVRTAREPGRRAVCINNLRNIALALRGYADKHGALPPAYTVDANGKPLHSWRTLILPYLEQHALYRSIDLSKPWDDPANAAARKAIVELYGCPSAANPDGRTTYLAIVGSNCCFRPDAPRKLSEISDGQSETIMIVEVDLDHAVPWMSPVDADEQVVLGIGDNSSLAHPGGLNVAFVDCHVKFLSADTPAIQRRALMSIAGNDNAAAEGDF